MKKIPVALTGLIAALSVGALATVVLKTRRSPAREATVVMPSKATVNQDLPEKGSLNQNTGNPASTVPDQDLRHMREYQIGRQLGSCLVRGCSIFLGTVRAIGEPEKEAEVEDDRAVVYRKVEVDIEQWIWGAPQGGKLQIVVTYASRPLMSKTLDGPWSAWEGAEVKVGGRLLVALWGDQAQRSTSMGKQEEVAVAASSDDLVGRIRESVALHERLLRSAAELPKVPRLLRSKPDDLTAGYLLSYVIEAESSRDVNQAALTLSSLLSNDKLAEIVRVDIVTQLLSYFNRLSSSTHNTVAESLVGTASSDDVKVAEFATSILVRLSDEGALSHLPGLNGERRRKLARNYHSALKKGLIEKGHCV